MVVHEHPRESLRYHHTNLTVEDKVQSISQMVWRGIGFVIVVPVNRSLANNIETAGAEASG